ncbi:MAG: hypothetical protein HUU55_15980 [Myxococcales bacterium]|nr:hypothetical protein [Myxococcales bacterium]
MKSLSWPSVAVSPVKIPAPLPGYDWGFFRTIRLKSGLPKIPLKNTSHLRWFLHYMLLTALAVFGFAITNGCGNVKRSPRELMKEGLSKAIPDEKLGPAAVLRVDDASVDPLFRDILVAASPHCPMTVSSETIWTVVSDNKVVFQLKEIAKVTAKENLEFAGEVQKTLERPGSPVETVRKSGLFVNKRFYTQDTSDVWLEHVGLRIDPMKWRHEALKPLPDLLDLLSPWFARSDVGPTTWHTLPARTVRLVPVSPHVRSEPVSDTERNTLLGWSQWWRGKHSLRELSGELVVETGCNCVVAADLMASVAIAKPNEPVYELRIKHHTTTQPLNSNPSIVAPSMVEIATRERVVPMIDEVLQDFLESR